MPAKAASTKSGRSRSSSRSRTSKSRSSKSRSRTRSRSRSRGRSPARATKRATKSRTPTKSTKIARPATPTRMSARLANQTEEKTVMNPIKVEGVEKKEKKQQHREFGGAIGTFLMTISLPLTVFYINLACDKKSCSIQNIPKLPAWSAFYDRDATLIFFGWFAFQALLYCLPIGRVVLGQPQPIGNNSRLPYRCNGLFFCQCLINKRGFFAYVVSIVAFFIAVYYKVPVTIVYDKFLPLMTTAIVFSFALAAYLYIRARLGPSNRLSPGGNTGNFIYDFFMGHELNPRIGSFDWKFFCEMRPGLIGWVMLNLVFLVKDYQQDGQLDYSLLLVVAFQALYIADALWFEDAILTTMDIVYEGFGLMLSFGDLAWVPFMYTLQGRYLLEHPHPLPWYCLAGIVVLNSVGYFIFRGSNSQKNDFRRDPNNPALAHLESIPTATKKRLLVSGWWGLCRKPNYLGDILMSISWSLPCGFKSLIPWFYPVYFTILLIHRERRDDAICRQKYQTSWDRYCEKVKYRIFPKVY